MVWQLQFIIKSRKNQSHADINRTEDTNTLPRQHGPWACDLWQVSKLLGFYLSNDLKKKQLLKSCYGTLLTLRKLKHFTDFKLRKHLAESLILFKINCDIVFYPIPKFLSTRLQRLQFAAACFVTSKYVNNVSTLIKLGWLPINERRDFSLLKQTFKAMYIPRWPSYLNLEGMKRSLVLNRVANWTDFVLNRVSVWSPRRHTLTQTAPRRVAVLSFKAWSFNSYNLR